jgi:hypothetical protein
MKKILLLLITIISFSFADMCNQTVRYVGYSGPEHSPDSCPSGSSFLGNVRSGSVWVSKCLMSLTSQVVCGTRDAPLPVVDGKVCFYDTDNNQQCETPPPNGSIDENGNYSCNSGYSLVGQACYENPANGYYDPFGEKQCNEGYFPTGSSNLLNACMNTPYIPENNDGSCPSGWTLSNDGSCFPPTSGDSGSGSTGGDSGSGSTGGDSGSGSTGGDSGSGSTGGDSGSGSTGGDSGSGSTGGDSGSGSTGGDSGSGSTGGDSGSGSTGGGSGTSTGGTGGDTENVDNVSTAAYTCNDGGKSITTSSGLQSCDRTCEDIGLITDENSMCKTSASCPEGQTQAGINYLTNTPICYALSTDPNLKNSETLLAKIVENTSKNQNSNTQLGSINKNIISTNGKLEAVKGGLSAINTNITGVKDNIASTNGLLEGIGTILTDMVTPMSDEKQSELQTKIESKLTTTLNDTFTKYSNVLGFGSSYSNAPDNITVTLFGKVYTLIDFSLLDDYVSIIRTLFLSLAYLYGFMNLLKGGK